MESSTNPVGWLRGAQEVGTTSGLGEGNDGRCKEERWQRAHCFDRKPAIADLNERQNVIDCIWNIRGVHIHSFTQLRTNLDFNSYKNLSDFAYAMHLLQGFVALWQLANTYKCSYKF